MTIELNPKYQIGEKIDRQELIDNHLFTVIHLEVTGIIAFYDFKTKELKYNYELSYTDGQYKGWVYQVVSL